MTTLEWVLLIILWIGYGAFAAYQTDQDDTYKAGTYMWYILFSPGLFIIKCFYGAFKKYNDW